MSRSQLSLFDAPAAEPSPSNERRPVAEPTHVAEPTVANDAQLPEPAPTVALDPHVRAYALEHLVEHAISWGLEFVEDGLLATEIECSLRRTVGEGEPCATLTALAADGLVVRGPSYSGEPGWRLADEGQSKAWASLRPQVLAALAEKARVWEPGVFVRTGLLDCEVEHLAKRDISTDALEGVLAQFAAEGVAEKGLAYHGDEGWRLAEPHASQARLNERAFALAPSAPSRPTRRGRAVAPSHEPAAPPTRRLTDRQRELLQGFEVDGLNVARCLLTEHVGDWADVKAVFVALGAKWQKGGKKQPGGFRFPDDADGREVLRVALESGEILDPKAAGFFPTNPDLADELAAFVDPRPGDVILEPSAGKGALALAIRRRCPEAIVACVELLPDNRKALEAQGFEVIGTDFLTTDLSTLGPCHIVANPPFSGRADVRHITRMIEVLPVGGRLAAIASGGVAYRDDAVGRDFRALLAKHGATITANPPGSFLESGTGVSTVTIKLTKAG